MVLNLGVRVDTNNEVVSHSLGLAKGVEVALLKVGWTREKWLADMSGNALLLHLHDGQRANEYLQSGSRRSIRRPRCG